MSPKQSAAAPPSPPPNPPPSRGTADTRIALAAVAGAHGVKGEIRLKLFSDSVESLSRHEKLYVAGVERRLLAIRDGGKAAVARLEGISDRSQAEALRGSLVEVERSALPPLEEGEYYHADLIGLPAVGRDGKPAGIVVAVENYGAGDLLEIELENGRRSLIPFKPGIADMEDGRIVIDPEFLA
ncbi:MAG: ribosome maturation factor RimM [Sphingomicrobium sp.]